MKKLVALSLALVMVMGSALQASAGNMLSLNVNGVSISFDDAKPYVDINNRTMVPVRFVSEALGANVAWDSNTQVITITKGNSKVLVTIGKQSIVVDGVDVQMDTTAVLSASGRTYVPVKYIAEALNASIAWDGVTSTVSITEKAVDKLSAITAIIKMADSTVMAESEGSIVLSSEKSFADVVAYYEDVLKKLDAKELSKEKDDSLFAYDGNYGEDKRTISIAIVKNDTGCVINANY